MPLSELSEQARQDILHDLASGPKSLSGIVTTHHPKAQLESSDPIYTRYSRACRQLYAEHKITKQGNVRNPKAPWVLRTKPKVDDLPKADAAALRKRGPYRKRDAPSNSAAATAEHSLRAYLIRDIRTKLDELERLG